MLLFAAVARYAHTCRCCSPTAEPLSCSTFDACVQARTDRRLLALTPQVNVGEADRIVVAQDRVLLLGELCARCTSQSMQVVSTAINGALRHVVRAWQAVGVARRGSLISSALPKPICGAAARVATGATGATGAKAAELETIASMAEIKSDDLSEHGGMHNAQRSSAGRRERVAATDSGWAGTRLSRQAGPNKKDARLWEIDPIN